MKTLRGDILARKERYDKGHKEELLEMMRMCLIGELPIPPWLAERFLAAYDKVTSYEVSSWDDVFGRPLKPGKSRKAAHWRNKNWISLWSRVRDRHEAGENIDKGLFESVGKDFGVGATTAESLYRETNRAMEQMKSAFEKDFSHSQK